MPSAALTTPAAPLAAPLAGPLAGGDTLRALKRANRDGAEAGRVERLTAEVTDAKALEWFWSLT